MGGLNENARDRNRLCIEDPFETPYNVARTVTKDGLYTVSVVVGSTFSFLPLTDHSTRQIRGEFMRATRILTARPERAVLALAELCIEREEELARAPRSSSPSPRSMSGRGGYGGGGGGGGGSGNSSLGGRKNGMSAGPFDRVSQTLNGMLPSAGEIDDFGRRAYSGGGSRRGRRHEGRGDFSAGEGWLAGQGSGADHGFGAGRFGSSSDMFGATPYGAYDQSRSGSMSEGLGSASGMLGSMPGSASAPISPVQAASGLHNQDSQRYSGTWSTGPSPRPAQQGLQGGRGVGASGHQQSGGGGGPRYGNQRRPQRGAYGPPDFPASDFDRYGPGPHGYSSTSSQHGGRRGPFSGGPSPQASHAFPPTVTPGNVSPSELAKINGSDSMHAFQPFPPTAGRSGPPGGGQGDSSTAGGHPSYISPSTLLSPETNPLSSLPTMDSTYPKYRASGSGGHGTPLNDDPRGHGASIDNGNEPETTTGTDREDLQALDELTSRVGNVALGLDDETEAADLHDKMSHGQSNAS